MESIIDFIHNRVNTHCMEQQVNARLGPDAWVNVAYEAFERGGVNAVRVDPLAKQLGITRGSFYWHFKDRRALLLAVIEKWATLATDDTIRANEAEGGPPSERLLRLLRTCASDDGRLEMSIRAWANEDAEASHRVEAIDERRIGYMTKLSVACGIAEDDAYMRSRVGYLAWLGSYTGAVPTPIDQRMADIECLWRMMLT